MLCSQPKTARNSAQGLVAAVAILGEKLICRFDAHRAHTPRSLSAHRTNHKVAIERMPSLKLLEQDRRHDRMLGRLDAQHVARADMPKPDTRRPVPHV